MKPFWQYIILYISTAGMEACWLFALLSLLIKHLASESLSVIILLLLFPLAFIVNKVTQLLKWPKVFILSLSWLICVLLILLMVKIQLFGQMDLSNPAWLQSLLQSIPQVIYSFRPELLVLMSGLVLWWLGQRLAYRKFSFSLSLTEFQFGLIIIIIVFLITSALKIDLASSIPVTVAFFIFALAGISIAHAQEDRNWISEIYKGHWLWLLITGIGIILIIGFLIGTLVSPNLLQIIIAGFKWIWGLILKFIALIASLLSEPEAAELPPITPIPDIGPDAEGFRLWRIPESIRTVLNIGMGIIWAGLIIAALWQISSQIYKWLHLKFNSTAGVEVESLSGAFRADIIRLMRGIVSMVLRIVSRFRLFKKPISIPQEVASVRQIYNNMLRWAAKAGYPRNESQTPFEYLTTLLELLPEARQDLNYVTEQYVSTRYSTSIPNSSEIQQFNRSWHRIKQNRFKKSS